MDAAWVLLGRCLGADFGAGLALHGYGLGAARAIHATRVTHATNATNAITRKQCNNMLSNQSHAINAVTR
eukprot:1235662-Lingulodinium_polyedra.AAC.1